MKCRICGKQAALYETFSNIVIEPSKLHSEPILSEGVDVNLFNCEACGHFQIPYINENNYDEYIISTGFSSKMHNLQSEQAQKLAGYAKQKRQFIEVGCGDGHFLAKAAQHFEKVVGVEPSKPFYEICTARGLTIINEYLSEETKFEGEIDAFAARQVFEHLDDPAKILQIIHSKIDTEAVGLIEVPNMQKIVAQGRYYDLFSDHINYFTPLSLCKMVIDSGFDILLLQENFDGDYLEIFIRKSNEAVKLKCKRDDDYNLIKQCLHKYPVVSVWGAGLKAQSIMTAFAETVKFRYVFDSDVNKQGKYIVNCIEEITQPTSTKVNESDLIIVMAISYQDEIVNVIRNEYGYRGDILCFKDKPEIIRF
ncbi:class I SAM-dependent methyltransferase [Azotosporobacter soli]|uniref:class I SAM-dependent methyltransferase n=1 Tax=Azotosporobacter soli TaxID=3055040 RepID=UPI0031FE52DB